MWVQFVQVQDQDFQIVLRILMRTELKVLAPKISENSENLFSELFNGKFIFEGSVLVQCDFNT